MTAWAYSVVSAVTIMSGSTETTCGLCVRAAAAWAGSTAEKPGKALS